MSQELGKKPRKGGEVDVKRVQNFNTAMVKVLVAWLCLTLGKPMNCSPPGSSVHGVLQAGILEWGAISFSRESSFLQGIYQLRIRAQVSCVVGRFFTI